MPAVQLVWDREMERESERTAFLDDLQERIVGTEEAAYKRCIGYLPAYGNQEPTTRMNFYWLMGHCLESILEHRTRIEWPQCAAAERDDLRGTLRGLVEGLFEDFIAPEIRIWGTSPAERLVLYERLCIWAAIEREVALCNMAAEKLAHEALGPVWPTFYRGPHEC